MNGTWKGVSQKQAVHMSKRDPYPLNKSQPQGPSNSQPRIAALRKHSCCNQWWNVKGDEVNHFCLHSKAIWSILWASSGGVWVWITQEERVVSVFVWKRSGTIWIFFEWSLFLDVLVRALISNKLGLSLNSVFCILNYSSHLPSPTSRAPHRSLIWPAHLCLALEQAIFLLTLAVLGFEATDGAGLSQNWRWLRSSFIWDVAAALRTIPVPTKSKR